jgi:hypothetical protein
MKLTTVILATAITVTAGAAYAQNPDAIDNARSIAKSLQQKQANDTNAALDAAGVPATSAPSKPAPGAPAPAVKPAVIPGSQASASAPAAKAASAPAKVAAASSESNQLQHVNVVPGSDDIQIEISARDAVTPHVSKLSSPARILVELPETVVASAQNKIPVGSGGVKGVRIGMDGKTPPTTSVVVDLDKALAYDVAPSPAGKIVLIVHTQGGAPAVAKTAAPAVKSTPVTQTASKPAPAAPKVAIAKAPAAPAPKAAAPVAKADTKTDIKTAAKSDAKPATKTVAIAAKPAAPAAAPEAPAKTAEAAKPKPEEKKWAMNGKRDPFFSPVVQQAGSGCSTGKKCLEINGINLRGVVKSDNGFIAVVTNNIGKAYFLRENDPVFNGYVVKITGDSVVFQETVQDKLGKTSTHEVVKRIVTPAV